MAESMETDQLRFWKGSFGDGYVDRNAPSAELLQSRTAMWARMLSPLAHRPPESFLEVGANVGNNLRALGCLTRAKLSALEPFEKARARLVADGIVPQDRIVMGSAEDIKAPDGAFDMAFTSGVLIHIAPANLLAACRQIHRVSRRYIACAEYFSPNPEDIIYRGEKGFLFKRDFGSFYLENFPDLQIVDYGFFWKPLTGLDNLTWWLFEKRAG